jgi:hypothetical protein
MTSVDDNPFNTKVISVSVSNEFVKLIERYKLSPTEVFRKGMAVSLFESGEDRYQSETNKKRTEYANAFIEEYKRNKVLKKVFDDILSLQLLIDENSVKLIKKDNDDVQFT